MSKKQTPSSKRIALAMFLAGMTVTLPLVVSPPAAHAATTGTVQGYVRDESGAPQQGVRVILGDTGQKARTDKNGYYVFTGVNPGTYEVRAELVTFKPATAQVTVQQDNTSSLDFSLVKATITGSSRVNFNPVRRNEVPTQSTISAKLEQETKSQPNNLYQFPGLVFGQPGITYDPSGYVHIRGSDLFQTGFNVDGVQIIDPLTNEFATNIVTVGLKSANLYTGGTDASYGNATGGYINEVTANGKDLRGGIVEGTFGPGYGWHYSGTNTQYGNITPDGKVDYYASTIAFRNYFPGNTSTQAVNASFDGALKFNYYASPSDTVSAFYSHGFEQYDLYQPKPDNYDPTTDGQNIKFEPGAPNPSGVGNAVITDKFQLDHDDQGYDFSYITYKHNFNTKSFASYRLYRLYNFLYYHVESLGGQYRQQDVNTVGHQVDYSNQISPKYQLRAGIQYLPSTTSYHLITGIAAPLTAASTNGYTDRSNAVKPTQTIIYLSNQIKPLGDAFTLSLGARYANMKYDLQRTGFSNFNKSYLDPRIGATYSPTRDLVFRTSYGVQSQFAETRFLGYEAPEDSTRFSPTAANPTAQQKRIHSRYSQFNELGPAHANTFDLGVEKAFNLGTPLVGGNYAFSLTGFTRSQRDLPQLNYGNFDLFSGPPYPLSYNTASHGHASGVELVLSRRPRNANDLNGFISYTNQVVKATSSYFDTGYLPYFANTFLGIPGVTAADFAANNGNEYPTSYDQRHTVAVVVNKRINKFIEESAFLDAGSGFPFAGGAASDGAFGSVADAQHGEKSVGGADFGQVPVVLLDNQTLTPLNPVAGRSGWHYKVTLNTNFNLTPTTSLFLNVDNVFDKKTVVTYATSSQSGNIYYTQPTAQYPQGRINYGPSTIITPIFLSFGFRHKF